MKYKELLEVLQNMSEKELNAEVKVFYNVEREAEDGTMTKECRLLEGGIELGRATYGAVSPHGTDNVTDDYYGVLEEDMGYKFLLACGQPYLAAGHAYIPTCKSKNSL